MADAALATPPTLCFTACGDFVKDWAAFKDSAQVVVHPLTLPLPAIPVPRILSSNIREADVGSLFLRPSSAATGLPTALSVAESDGIAKSSVSLLDELGEMVASTSLSPLLAGSRASQTQPRIVTVTASDPASLTQLLPRGIIFNSASFAGLIYCITICSTLTTLSFWNCRISNQHLLDLVTCLSTSSISTLQVDQCPVADDTLWSALIHATQDDTSGERSSVQHLTMRYNEIGERGAAAMFGKLKSCRHLVSLNLTGNKIGREGCDHITDALKNNIKLQALTLAHNNICDDSVQSIAKGLAKQPLSAEEFSHRKKYLADVERVKQQEDELLQQQQLQQQELAKKNVKGKQDKTRAGSATAKKDENSKSPPDNISKTKGDTSKLSATTGAFAPPPSGVSGKAKASNADLNASSSAANAGGKKLPVPDKNTKSPSKVDKSKKAVGKKPDKDDSKEDNDEREESVAPPPFDINMFEINGSYYNWGNRTLLSLNLSYNRITTAGCKALLDAVVDQRRMNILADKNNESRQGALSSIGELEKSSSESTLRQELPLTSYVPRTTSSGLWRCTLQGNTIDHASDTVQKLTSLIDVKMAAPPKTFTPTGTGRRESYLTSSMNANAARR